MTLAAARAVGSTGRVQGVDLSGHMVDAATARASACGLANATFARMDGERLSLPDGHFDAALCALGLMYMPDPSQSLRELRRVLRPGGRVAFAVWGEREACGWSPVFAIVAAEVESDVCPLFFRLGDPGALARSCADAGFERIQEHRIDTTLRYANGDEACDAAFVGGPVALAWSRFDKEVRTRVCALYLDAIAAWKVEGGYALPGRLVVVAAISP